jgi:hypothetical protein
LAKNALDKITIPKNEELDLNQLRRHAREYVEMEANTKVVSVRFKQRLSLFGEEDAIFLVDTADATERFWWVVGGSTPMNLYARSKFATADVAQLLRRRPTEGFLSEVRVAGPNFP